MCHIHVIHRRMDPFSAEARTVLSDAIRDATPYSAGTAEWSAKNGSRDFRSFHAFQPSVKG